jgi:hypothetical protein
MHVKFSAYSGVLYVVRSQHIADIRLPATYPLRDLYERFYVGSCMRLRSFVSMIVISQWWVIVKREQRVGYPLNISTQSGC